MLRYTGLEHAFAMSMGIAGTPAVATDGTDRTHTFQLATNLDGLFDTMAVMRVGPATSPALPIWEYPSVKYTGFVAEFTSDGLATITFPLIASSCKSTTGQVTTAMNTVTYRSKVLNVFGTHVKFRALATTPGTDTSASLSDANKFYPSRVTLTYRRNMDSSFVMDGSGVQPEPYYTAAPEITLAFEFPVYGTGTLQTNNTFLTNAFAETPMKADITCTSPVLAGAATVRYSLLFEFPNLVIGNVEMPVTGPGVIPQNVTMSAIERSVAPVGMTGLTKPFRVINVSQMATDALLSF